ncbi:MAG: carotenoid 1,2-hydratase [Rhodopseudomonas palustris]|nr:carotenoid 1,2-hydratase [Rhodopseudomonas palustris]
MLTGEDGRDYGIQWTLFRSALAPRGAAPGWDSPQLWPAHAALTTPDRRPLMAETLRARRDRSGRQVAAEPFEAWIDDWRNDRAARRPAPIAVSADPGAFGRGRRVSAVG